MLDTNHLVRLLTGSQFPHCCKLHGNSRWKGEGTGSSIVSFGVGVAVLERLLVVGLVDQADVELFWTLILSQINRQNVPILEAES
jgi:hypothetical protein